MQGNPYVFCDALVSGSRSRSGCIGDHLICVAIDIARGVFPAGGLLDDKSSRFTAHVQTRGAQKGQYII